MRNLIVCCDGTWNSPVQLDDGVPVPTNVVKFHRALAASADVNGTPVPQIAYYHTGVGAESGWLKGMAGGAFGRGLDRIICSAYKWIAEQYEPGDRLFLVGFSRGAYTVRSLSSFIGRIGLLKAGTMDEAALDNAVLDAYEAYQHAALAEAAAARAVDAPSDGPSAEQPAPRRSVPWERVWQAFDLYAASRRFKANERESLRYAAIVEKQQRFKAQHCIDATPDIHFIGVWDTVGALGIPMSDGWRKVYTVARTVTFKWLPDRSFHDTSLSERTKNAFHAIAIDERRTSFAPTLWTGVPKAGQRVEQVWFPGVHGDVGGGYKEDGLADVALAWMIGAAERCGAAFKPEMVRQLRPDFQGVIHDSVLDFKHLMESQPREVPCLTSVYVPFRGRSAESVSPEAVARHHHPPIRQAPYWPTTVLSRGQDSGPIPVYAREYWCPTGIYLEPGEYHFASSGSWKDSWYVVESSGWNPWWHPGFVVAAPFRRRFAWRDRSRSARWFSLVLQIADQDNPDHSGAIRELTTVRGEDLPLTLRVEKGGYLFGFANDAALPLLPKDFLLKNNQGSVQLRVTRFDSGSSTQHTTVPGSKLTPADVKDWWDQEQQNVLSRQRQGLARAMARHFKLPRR